MEGKDTGALLRRLRLEANMTQRELAEALRVSPQAVSKWETGAGCPDVGLLAALAAERETSLHSRQELERLQVQMHTDRVGREALLERQRQVRECIAYSDRKQDFYDDVLAGKTPYVSDLIDTD